MLPFSNWAMVRLYQVTGMLRIPNCFVKETEICVFKDALWQKRIKKYCIVLYCILKHIKYGVDFFSQRVISYQIIGTASFTACLGPQPNRHNCSLIISLPRWQWKRTKNSKSGTARTCSNGVMAIMGTRKRVLQCMVCMFE